MFGRNLKYFGEFLKKFNEIFVFLKKNFFSKNVQNFNESIFLLKT